MKRFLIPVVAATIGGSLLFGCDKKEEAPAEDKPVASAPSKHDVSGEAIVRLEEATQQLVGLKVETLTSAQLPREVKGYGRVIDSTPLAGLVNELTSAQAVFAASSNDYARLKTLSAQNNASVRALQAAEAASVRDQAQYESARLKLLSSWGSAVTRQEDLATFIRSLSSLESVLVRIDLPAGEWLKVPPLAARMSSLRDELTFAVADFFAPVPTTDPQAQSQGFFFLVKTNSLHFVPEMAVTAYLQMTGEPLTGVLVPESAIVRYQEKSWLYVQTDSTTFTRKQAALKNPGPNGWLITEGVEPNARLVIGGAQILLSEELKSQIHMGD